MDIILNSWHWAVSGFLIGIIMLLLTYFGKTFGMSSNLRTICTVFGSKKYADYFDFDWREQKWNLAIVLGAIFGGFFAFYFLNSNQIIELNPKTISNLNQIGIDVPKGNLVPNVIFSIKSVMTLKGFLILLCAGFLIGFGTPYAGGCTSGHAISGLSNLQLPSLIAVLGFFIGGFVMAHFIIPILF